MLHTWSSLRIRSMICTTWPCYYWSLWTALTQTRTRRVRYEYSIFLLPLGYVIHIYFIHAVCLSILPITNVWSTHSIRHDNTNGYASTDSHRCRPPQSTQELWYVWDAWANVCDYPAFSSISSTTYNAQRLHAFKTLASCSLHSSFIIYLFVSFYSSLFLLLIFVYMFFCYVLFILFGSCILMCYTVVAVRSMGRRIWVQYPSMPLFPQTRTSMLSILKVKMVCPTASLIRQQNSLTISYKYNTSLRSFPVLAPSILFSTSPSHF